MLVPSIRNDALLLQSKSFYTVSYQSVRPVNKARAPSNPNLNTLTVPYDEKTIMPLPCPCHQRKRRPRSLRKRSSSHPMRRVSCSLAPRKPTDKTRCFSSGAMSLSISNPQQSRLPSPPFPFRDIHALAQTCLLSARLPKDQYLAYAHANAHARNLAQTYVIQSPRRHSLPALFVNAHGPCPNHALFTLSIPGHRPPSASTRVRRKRATFVMSRREGRLDAEDSFGRLFGQGDG